MKLQRAETPTGASLVSQRILLAIRLNFIGKRLQRFFLIQFSSVRSLGQRERRVTGSRRAGTIVGCQGVCCGNKQKLGLPDPDFLATELPEEAFL